MSIIIDSNRLCSWFDGEGSPTGAALLGLWVVDNAKGRADQLFIVVHCGAPQVLQGVFVHHHTGPILLKHPATSKLLSYWTARICCCVYVFE